MNIKVGTAPVSWGIMEAEGWNGHQSYARVLDEMAQAGYEGTELGPYGYLPTEPERLIAELSSRGLRLVSAFVPVHLAESQLHESDLAKLHCPLLLSVGDRDELVSLEEISKLYLSLDKNKVSLAVHANSPHPISKLDKGSFTHAVREFWKSMS